MNSALFLLASVTTATTLSRRQTVVNGNTIKIDQNGNKYSSGNPHINWYADSNCRELLTSSTVENLVPTTHNITATITASGDTENICSAMSIDVEGLYVVRFQNGTDNPTDNYLDGECFSGNDIRAIIHSCTN